MRKNPDLLFSVFVLLRLRRPQPHFVLIPLRPTHRSPRNLIIGLTPSMLRNELLRISERIRKIDPIAIQIHDIRREFLSLPKLHGLIRHIALHLRINLLLEVSQDLELLGAV